MSTASVATRAFPGWIGRQRACLVVSVAALAAGCARELVREVSAADTFAIHCAACHGPHAEGDGPAAVTLSVPVPNLRTLTQRNGQFPAEWVASKIDGRDLPGAHGSRVMPVWGEVFDTTGQLFENAENAKQRIDAMVAYLRELQVAEN